MRSYRNIATNSRKFACSKQITLIEEKEEKLAPVRSWSFDVISSGVASTVITRSLRISYSNLLSNRIQSVKAMSVRPASWNG